MINISHCIVWYKSSVSSNRNFSETLMKIMYPDFEPWFYFLDSASRPIICMISQTRRRRNPEIALLTLFCCNRKSVDNKRLEVLIFLVSTFNTLMPNWIIYCFLRDCQNSKCTFPCNLPSRNLTYRKFRLFAVTIEWLHMLFERQAMQRPHWTGSLHRV